MHCLYLYIQCMYTGVFCQEFFCYYTITHKISHPTWKVKQEISLISKQNLTGAFLNINPKVTRRELLSSFEYILSGMARCSINIVSINKSRIIHIIFYIIVIIITLYTMTYYSIYISWISKTHFILSFSDFI